MTDYKKIIQSLCYIGGKCRGRRMSKIHALKVIYLADRYHLRKFGSTITGDSYWAMPMGPVASSTKKVIEGSAADKDMAAYALDYIMPDKDRYQSKIVTTFDELAKTDIEALDAAYDAYLDRAPENIVTYTHRFPEWHKHQARLDAGASRVKMSMLDFFEPSMYPRDEYCPASEEQVSLNREIYLDTPECLRA